MPTKARFSFHSVQTTSSEADLQKRRRLASVIACVTSGAVGLLLLAIFAPIALQLIAFQLKYRAIDRYNIARVAAINSAYHLWKRHFRVSAGTPFEINHLYQAGFLDKKWLSEELPDRFFVSHYVLKDPDGIICTYRPVLVRRTLSRSVPDKWDQDFRKEMEKQDPQVRSVLDVFNGWGRGERIL